MYASSGSAAADSATRRLDALAFGLLATLPLGMALLNRSAQPIVIAAAIVALLARTRAGDLGAVRDRIVGLLTTPIGLCALLFGLLALVSLSWGHHVRISVSALGEVAAAAGAALVLHAALPDRVPPWAVKLATIAIALGCLTIIAELASGLTLRASLGGRAQTFIFKRSVTAILLVAWPVAAFLWFSGRRSIAVALALLLCVATYAAHSSATALGMAVGLGALLLAAWSRRLVSGLLAGAIVLAFLTAPFLGDGAERLLPARAIAKLDFAHARERIDIWQSFGEVVKRRPLLGVGFGTSPAMAREPVASEVPEGRRLMLGAWHPHNGYLQVWSELGLAGAVLAGIALVLVALRTARPGVAAPVAAAVLASAAAVMLVGHGAWQGWWATMLGAAAIWLARLGEPELRRLERPRPSGHP